MRVTAMRYHSVRVFAILVGMFQVGTAAIADPPAEAHNTTVYHVYCFGTEGKCLEIHLGGSYWVRKPGLRVYEDPYPYPLATVCPAGSQWANNIFLFEPGSTSVGFGLIGTSVCADTTNAHFFFEIPTGAATCTSYDEWIEGLIDLQ
jgi:hypothetical protein